MVIIARRQQVAPGGRERLGSGLPWHFERRPQAMQSIGTNDPNGLTCSDPEASELLHVSFLV